MAVKKTGLSVRLSCTFGFILTMVAAMTVVAAVSIGAAESSARLTVLTCGVFAVVAGALAGWWTIRDMNRSLREALSAAQRIASGDLTSQIATDRGGELGALMQALQEMNGQVFKIVSEVRTGITTVASTSSQINRDNTALSERTETQAVSLRETVASMDQLTLTVRQNAENATRANQHVLSTSQHAARGGEVVGQVVETMGSIKESSSKIVDIISVIDGIAFQTNILALNAAVEAARAGEQGRGFAVVAAEVRTLAQRSASAAREIKTLIADSVEKVESGSRLVDDAGRAMNEIVSSVKHVADLIKEINSAGNEQSAGIQSVNQAVGQVDDMTQQNAKLVQDATKTAVTLNEQAVGLLKSVAMFKLGDREYGTPEEAEGMVKAGIAFFRQHGKSAIVDEINKLGKGRFIDRDLYLFAVDIDSCVFIAHGNNPRTLGAGPVSKDADGKLFVRDMATLAKNKGTGWIEYKWAHPVTNEIKVKTSYVERVGDMLIACGVYKQ
jgi:methyl-accepting chemotaxis protein